jgi:hypothetical protein
MTRDQLKSILTALKVNHQAYCLDGGLPDEKYTLDQVGVKWVVYYSERGQRSGERLFNSEDQACRYMLELLVKDTTTRFP